MPLWLLAGCSNDAATGDAGTVHDAAVAEPPARLPPSAALPLDWARGAPLAPGVVSGRIYDDLAAHPHDRMQDLAALGVRVVRIEIERATPWAVYEAIVAAAREAGIEVLAVVSANSVAEGTPGPLTGTLAEFDALFIPAYLAALDETIARLGVHFVEIWNEPDNFGFAPMFGFEPGCVRKEGATRYALLAVRAFETLDQRRRMGMTVPAISAFGVSRQDDGCLRSALFDAEPIRNHRLAYRPDHALADGLPADILAMHGYGNSGKTPAEPGYTYAGGTFAEGVDELISSTFSDGRPVIGALPIWYTEVGYSLRNIGGVDPAARQAEGLATVFDVLRARPQVTAAFWYDYRDDEPGGDERCGLRDSSQGMFAPHPAYVGLQAAAAIDDRGAPAGAVIAPITGAVMTPGSTLGVLGWAIDAGGAPTVEVAIDGKVITTVVDGNAPLALGCATAWSTRCPGGVGFAATVQLPTMPGSHELAVRASDSSGHARVIGRIDFAIL